MARLSSPLRPDGVTLPARALVGRSPGCAVVVRDPRVSGEHASLVWQEDRWILRDLGSRNGTWLGARRLGPGERVALNPGDWFAVGGEDLALTLLDASPPGVRARGPAGEERAATGEVLLLPDPENALYAVVVGEDGAIWVEDREGQRAPAVDGMVLSTEGGPWTLAVPESQPGTVDVREAPAITARFSVSRNEEHAEMEILVGDVVHPWPAKSYVYLLLTLARARLADADLPESEKGWMHQEDLASGLRIHPGSVGVYVHRARQQAADLGPGVASRLIERRRGSRELRFGLPVSGVTKE
jgi:hypothetical protein